MSDKFPPVSDTLATASPEWSRRYLEGLRLDDTPCHLIRRALKRAYDIFSEEMGEGGLRPPQVTVMIAIYQNPGITQNDLVRVTDSDRSTVAELTGRIESRGLLVRKRGQKDQRVNRLFLTDEGRAAIEAAMAGMDRAEARILSNIPESEQAEFVAHLKLIVEAEEDEVTVPSLAEAGR